MGSLEPAIPLKHSRSSHSPASGRRTRPRSALPRVPFVLKVDRLQLILAFAAVFLIVILLQVPFLPGEASPPRRRSVLEEIRDLEFGDGIEFVPSKLFRKLEQESGDSNRSALAQIGGPVRRFQLRRPQLAVVLPDLLPDAMQLKMVSVAAALKEIGFSIQVYSFDEGPAHIVWRSMGISVKILPVITTPETAVDWLEYSGILVNSIEVRPVFSCLSQEPFKSIPVIWTIEDTSLAFRLYGYSRNEQSQLIDEWKQVLNRATAVVFPTHFMLMMYSTFETDNYLVVPGSPAEAWEADTLATISEAQMMRESMGYTTEDFLVAVVGSQFSYSGMLLEHALVFEALRPLHQQIPLLKVRILGWNFSSAFKKTLEVVAQKVGFPSIAVENIASDDDPNRYLGTADLVIYGSFLEEQSFPRVLTKAMSLGKLLVAPDLQIIRKYVDNGVNGYLFPKENISVLTQILHQTISNGKLSSFAQKVGAVGKGHSRNLMASEAIQGYVSLLEKVIKFPSDIMIPKAIGQIPLRLKEQWQWELFVNLREASRSTGFRSRKFLDNLEERWNLSQIKGSDNTSSEVDEEWISADREEEKGTEMMSTGKNIEEELNRDDPPNGTWEEVYKNVRKAERASNELHERHERELERTGQPLCIYEPYFGEGTWYFLHQTSLYRGISLSSEGRRSETDDIDASSLLPLLNDADYRDRLGEYGAFFALAYSIDRTHKNAWIAFQSWRASAKKASLSTKAETALVKAIEDGTHGDAFYFWVRMDKDPRNPRELDFWTFCDAINAGNCRTAVSKAFQRMYGVREGRNYLPQMPNDDSWSVMQSWALPTRSFLEFVMFSRMFVDALDMEMYDEHHQNAHCYLSTFEDRHCYARVLELLVNVWAYHSARRIVHVDPEYGLMQEIHTLESRRGNMWIRWFSYSTLKSMDEDLAEEVDLDQPSQRRTRLWASTGDVVWEGGQEREMILRRRQKEKRRQENKERIERIKKRARQKTIGKHVPSPPGAGGGSNATEATR